MYMNAITVNYAEVGDDHLPISFGFVRNSDLTTQTTIYNSKKIKINDTCSVLTCEKLNSIDIIVSSNPETSRSLSQFSQGPSSWIEHKLPTGSPNSNFYIKYEDGYYYEMVENENGKSGWEQYAPYAYLTNVKDNASTQPYCEATIKTPVPLQVSAGSVKAVINSESVEIARTNYSLVIKLENANGTFSNLTIGDQYSIDTSIYDLNSINWMRDDKEVEPWLSGTEIVKSSMSTNGWTKTIKLLAGNNVVTIPRNKSTIIVKFTFKPTGMSSFEWGGAYHNGFNDSTMSDNTLKIYNVRQGSRIDLTTFYTDSETSWFKPSSIIDPLSGSGTFSVEVDIPTPSATDTIKFTGWIDGKLEQGYSIEKPHGILPQAYTIDKMNTENLSRVDITNENSTTINGLLTYDLTNKQFKRHRQITQINKSSPGTRTTTIADNRNPETTSTDIYIYASNNNVSQIFNVTAKYSDIPYIVDGDSTKGTTNQVVRFKNTNYVYNDGMKQLVKNLTNINVTSLNGSKNVTYYDPNIPVNVQFPDITFSITVPSESRGGTVKETPSEDEVPPSSPIETTETYTATIKCTVADFKVTEPSFIIKKNNTIIKAPLIYNIQCTSINNGTQFTCTVNITKMTIQDKDYTISNATTSQTGNVQTVTKQLFS